MDAGPLMLVDLITQQSSRLVVPVYQRPYSWNEENCEQLWQDVLSVARRGASSHFTGSVVWVQDGTMSANGVTPRLVIDGQQRITTVMLLVIALARYARKHPTVDLPFSVDEIIDRGYLVDKYRKGDDRYKLTLSEPDRDALRTLIENVVDPAAPLPGDGGRLVDNLSFFEERLEGLDEVGLVWSGLRRLEVVSISLTQGQDNPQLIFESMNSTGKDLACADLVRNFVLMGQTVDEQVALYQNYWRPIERALGAEADDGVFDRFIRCWLTIARAPETPSSRDVYQVFKRHAIEGGWDCPGKMGELLGDLRRCADHYACVARGAEKDPELKAAFSDVADLGITVSDVLLVFLYGCYKDGALDRDGLLGATRTMECYLFRRLACDVASNGLNKFFPSLVARLRKVRDARGNLEEALAAMLLAEAGTPRRLPDDAEFVISLRERNAYSFRKSFLLLSRLENSYHSKAPIDFFTGAYTIEHIMPQAALKVPEWRAFLGEDPEEAFEKHVHTLGNLTLTAYNSELSDGTFEKKKERAEGGYNNDFLSISLELKEAQVWTPEQIEKRGARLAARAVEVWPVPRVSEDAVKKYRAEKGNKGHATGKGAASGTAQSNCFAARMAVWSEFWDSCAEDDRFSQVFGDMTERNRENTDNWVTLGVGYGFVELQARILLKEGGLSAGVDFSHGERYDELLAERNHVESVLGPLAGDCEIEWTNPRAEKLRRVMWVTRPTNYSDPDDLSDAIAWLRATLVALRGIVREVYR